MKKKTFFFGIVAALATLSACTQKVDTVACYQVVPLPLEIAEADSAAPGFKLDASTVITYTAGDTVLKRNAELLAEYLEPLTGLKLKTSDAQAGENAIVLTAGLQNDNKEAYRLTVNDKTITIDGSTAAGNFYGIQTLRKSIPSAQKQNVTFPAVTINDRPELGYRGAHLDVSRHFFPVDSVKKFIDVMALHNLNTFHWHLTEDQGWRIEIKSRPRLTEVGSVRKGTCIGHDMDSCDSVPYGGFYTQEEARDIVRYAADRHINVIPEIDMPGHMLAALTSYPELGCTGGPYELWTRWGVSEDVLCAGNDEVLKFLDDVFGELIDIFPSEYIHVGGDECPKTRWKDCPKCQAKAKELGLKDDDKGTVEEKLQSYLVHHASDFLTAHGRKMIGWDETLEGGLAPGAIVMSWRGMDGALAAAKAGHEAILTPTGFCYFDYYQSTDTENEPIAIGGFLPVDRVYQLNPTPDELTEEQHKHIIGVQCNLWTEYIDNFPQVLYMELPRMAALCEVGWCPKEKRDYDNFAHRMPQLINHYKVNDYRYAGHMFEVRGEIATDMEKKLTTFTLSTLDGSPIHYTTDGTAPDASSPVYSEPIAVNKTTVVKAVAVRADGSATRVWCDSVRYCKSTCCPITLATEPSSQYAAEGAKTLIDGRFGNDNLNQAWLGYASADLDAVIDLGADTGINTVSVGNILCTGDWVYNIASVEVLTSADGKAFTPVAKQEYPITTETKKVIKPVTLTFAKTTARYVRVVAKPVMAMPAAGTRPAGLPAWMFVDEIMVD